MGEEGVAVAGDAGEDVEIPMRRRLASVELGGLGQGPGGKGQGDGCGCQSEGTHIAVLFGVWSNVRGVSSTLVTLVETYCVVVVEALSTCLRIVCWIRCDSALLISRRFYTKW